METQLIQQIPGTVLPRKRVGLALGGGVVRGLAHIGVLAALEEAGIPVDYIAGTSVGGIIGVCYAAGISASQIKQYARQFNWWRISRPVISWRSDHF
jgi:NTE family protein